jgi:hypothetical protein
VGRLVPPHHLFPREIEMTLLAVKQKFIDSSGRRDLVDDLSAYADNGAHWFINAGQRMLDGLQPLEHNKYWYKRDIVSGEANLLIPNLRTILEGKKGGVWVTDSDSNAANERARYKLEKVDTEWMRSEYALSVSGLDTDRPKFYDPSIVKVSGDEIIQSGDLSDATKWSVGGLVSVTGNAIVYNGAAKLDAAAQSLTNLRIPLGIVNGRKYVVTFEMAEYSGDGELSVTLDSGASAGTARSGNGIYSEVIESTTAGTASFQLYVSSTDTLTCKIRNISCKEVGSYDTDGLVAARYEDYRGLTVMPPADQTYTISILGLFFSPALDYDENTSFWTEVYPETLVSASNYQLERYYRNSEGMKDWLASINLDLGNITKDEVMEDVAGVSHFND